MPSAVSSIGDLDCRKQLEENFAWVTCAAKRLCKRKRSTKKDELVAGWARSAANMGREKVLQTLKEKKSLLGRALSALDWAEDLEKSLEKEAQVLVQASENPVLQTMRKPVYFPAVKILARKHFLDATARASLLYGKTLQESEPLLSQRGMNWFVPLSAPQKSMICLGRGCCM
jgi:hypothetical protein